MFPLSFAQQRLWFANRMQGPSATHNIPIVVRLTGSLDEPALQSALVDLVERHETLRTVLREQDGQFRQEVLPAAEAAPTLVRMDSAVSEFCSAVMDGVALDPALAAVAARPFDLDADLPTRAALLRLSDSEHIMLLVIHHAFCDGWSLGPLLRDLGTAYTARQAGREPAWEPLPVRYSDYTLWQQDLLGSASQDGTLAAEQSAFWRRTLQGLPAELRLPFDRPRPASPSPRCGKARFSISPETHAAMVELGRQCQATLFMVLQAATAALLARHGSGTDIALGTAVAGRTDPALNEVVGLFVNTLVLRTDVSGAPTFRELVGRARDGDRAAYAHQDLPFEQVVTAVNPIRLRSVHPLCQVFVEMHDALPPAPLAGLQTEVHLLKGEVAKFDLSFSFREHHGPDGAPAGISGTIEYPLDLFDDTTVERIAERFSALIPAIVGAPDVTPSAIPTVTEDETRRLLAFTGATMPLPAASAVGTFELRAAESGDRLALVAGEEQLDYVTLNSRANRLAHHLISLGVGADAPVAVVLPRTADAVVAWLAVLKSGGTYLPVDPFYPDQRIRTVLADAGPVVLVTTGQIADRLGTGASGLVLVTDLVQADRSDQDPTDADRAVPYHPDHVAYVIYTSGSTGVPKGVAVTHRALVNELAFHSRVTYPAPRDPTERRRVALSASLSFDTSWEGVWALMAGHELHLLDESTRRDPARMVRYVRDHGIEQVDVTPSFAQQLLADGLLTEGTPVRTLMLGGETVTEVLWETLRNAPEDVTVYNYYGPSEFCVEASGCALTQHPRASIGRPLPNCGVYVLDENLTMVPPGVLGEIHLAGEQLGRGYLGRPGLTAQRFVPDPFGEPGARMYRSGDLGRWTEDGFLVFAGRADDQVKLRGFRIEPAEIRAAVLARPSVAECAVIVREDVPGDKRLVAYVVPEAGASPDVAELRAALAGQLPDYMVPAAFVVLDALPLTANAKIDFQALAEPRYGAPAEGRKPRTELERTVAELFAEVLRLDRVGLDDGFFELGGHSLLATRLVNRIRTVLGLEFDLMGLFDRPTVAGVAESLADAAAAVARPALVSRS
ncbi:amino acid adenylation domain-containing protein [Catenulispora subtropica]|uniref:Carrier domain-containing protein n=1 Tax=Catenulispora subtropica TaxID=450798 RepID=A0ABP5DLC3_9ACTN